MQKQQSNIIVREYALLVVGDKYKNIDLHSIPNTAFEWLLLNSQSNDATERNLIRVTQYKKQLAIKVLNFVGVLETPCGTRIEVLPKTSVSDDINDIIQSRKTLLKMLSAVHKIKLYQFEQTQLEILRRPLFETLIGQFLENVAHLVKRGIRSQYQRTHSETRFLKGRLLTHKQLLQRPGKQHFFHIEHDIFTADRAENRLVHSALAQVLNWSQSTFNQKLARELLFVFSEIPKSKNHTNDFRKWSSERSLSHYSPLKPWCELILSYQSPIAMSGKSSGLSFLFPMEVLFEKYVALELAKYLPKNLKLKEQAQSKSLLRHNGEDWFKLKPDMVIYEGKKIRAVLDTKWKLLNSSKNTAKHKYDLSQSDMYQMHAYGEKYLDGTGKLFLIYPKHKRFDEELQEFTFKDNLTLNICPFDLNDEDHKQFLNKLG
ncbi:restriction endonuclease [Parashewanella spongiae]|uniref:Restriction endonuclease n=1 Tax=Parashewanella spongiae TaxID=342950 RepID=A0A3A6U343_9GAMM|nr:McrC family protein [Parashewanella spongiae]MCL1078808.1 McrC family protein [Parashewanella spongiae]RJY11940.1 restriction endonuclease [Parashewanella spongiae]